MLTLRAYAKVNLALDIVGTLDNGYHAVKMVMQSIGLCDLLTITPCADAFSLTCDDPTLECDEKNTILRAANAFCARFGLPAKGAAFHLQKRIPMQAGLGGGSADAAAALVGLDALFETHASIETLAEIGASVGADIPFCLYGSTALAEGFGERITPLPSFPQCCFVIAKPEFSVSTKEAYSAYDHAIIRRRPPIDAMLASLARGDLKGVSDALGNVFEEVITDPAVEKVKRIMDAHGAYGALLTGTGSAVFGIFADAASADRCKEAIAQSGCFAVTCPPVFSGPALV